MAISGTDLLEVPTIYKAYVRPIYMVQYLHFRILKFPLNLFIVFFHEDLHS